MRRPEWAEWNGEGAGAPWTVGIEEEVMLLDPVTWMPASRSEEALAALRPEVAEHTSGETHGSAVELATDPHATVAGAVAQLAHLREGLSDGLRELNLAGAVAGTHPLATWQDTEVSPGARYQFLYASMRELARREPTFALHVHVAVPDEASAIRAYNGLREHLPMLLALSANSPFWQGRDSGLAAARIPVFDAFPRTGTPRRFETYGQYVDAVDVLLRCDAIPEPTFLWWDVRLQPALGTIELRIMDAQTRVRDTATLAALVQCLVRAEALGAVGEPSQPEVLEENRFLAARDGMAAEFVVPGAGCCVPAAELLGPLVRDVTPHAQWLRCERELAGTDSLARHTGSTRQRAVAQRPQGLYGVVHALHGDFVAASSESAEPVGV
jgi:glutamate---cysteine ligase / carboxylate-amine ligase